MTKKNNNNSENQENNHYVEYVKEHAQHAAEYGKNLMSTAHKTGNEVTKKVTDICANNLALCKSFLGCTSFDDMVHWGEKFVKTNVDNCIEAASSVYSKVCKEVTEANSDVAKKVVKNITNIKNKL